MVLAVLAVFLLVTEVLALDPASEPACGKSYRTTISAKTSFSNGTIRTSDGDWFHPGTYVNASNLTIEGCVCMIKTCVRKCCPQNTMLKNWTCIEEINGMVPLIISKEVGPPLEHFHLVYGKECSSGHNNVIVVEPILDGNLGTYYLSEDGVVSLESSERFQFYDYCIDHIDDTDVIKALVCKEPKLPTTDMFTSIGMLVSTFFCFATFVVYAALPKKNFYSKCLMHLSISLLMAYLLYSLIQLNQFKNFSYSVCLFMSSACYFFCFVAFFTANSIILDIWRKFRTINYFSGNTISDKKSRFIYYSLYMWGVPALLVAILIALNETIDATAWYHPQFGKGKCWFGSDFSRMLYFYSIVAIILIADVLLFAMTALRIEKIQKDIQILKINDAARKYYERDRQRFKMYVKLMLVVGFNWVTQLIKWVVNWQVKNVPEEIWYLTDLCNNLHGVSIFFTCVFKKKILTQFRERIATTIRKSHKHQGVSETTINSRSTSVITIL